jgi:preprotein translocase subunit SecF
LVAFLGLKLSIDFKGGAQTEMIYTTRPTTTEVQTALDTLGQKDALVQEVGTQKISIKTQAL